MTTLDTFLSVRTDRRPHRSLRTSIRRGVDGVSALIAALLDWQERARQRRQLLALSDGALKDFGASRADAEGEGGKPAWRS